MAITSNRLDRSSHRIVTFESDPLVRMTSSGMPSVPTIQLRGASLHAITESDCVRLVLDELDAGRGGWVVTMNLDHLRRFVQDPICRARYARASLILADGMPLVWASRLQEVRLPERVAGSNLIWSLSALAAERGRSIFLLGGAPGTAQATAQVLCNHYSQLRIAGLFCPERGFETQSEALAQLVSQLERAQPDIVYVALGAPKQDELIERLRERLPRAWWLGVGISFSFVSGKLSRAPTWMQRAGLEWLHRLAQEPRRLGKRYLLQGIPSAALLFADALAHWTKSRFSRAAIHAGCDPARPG